MPPWLPSSAATRSTVRRAIDPWGGGLANGTADAALGAERADLWNDWLVWGRSWPDAVPPLRQRMDEACAAVGRDPAGLERTVTI
jgi:alkanesulfonate monooxygenase SsuD/methylene tetrahydromethanopterin reductase-like flavin-dependent oxidoreductase (luciferase family)